MNVFFDDTDTGKLRVRGDIGYHAHILRVFETGKLRQLVRKLIA